MALSTWICSSTLDRLVPPEADYLLEVDGEERWLRMGAVPLLAKDQIVGVLEVLNKSNGLPFTQDEVKLLSTFASQAGVAIENARLFEMTGLEVEIWQTDPDDLYALVVARAKD